MPVILLRALTFVKVSTMAPMLALIYSMQEAQEQACQTGLLTEIVRSVNPYYASVGVAAATVAAVSGYYMWPRGLRMEVDPMRISPEGLIPGKPVLEGGRVPSCQVKLAYKREDGTFVILGAGVRVLDHLITPAHNAIHGRPLFAMAKDCQVEILGDGLNLAADVVAFPLSEQQWSRMGITRAKLAPLGAPRTVSVISSCDLKYSVGRLTAITPMGRVKYDSSTMPGFSGSVYADGNTALGMHCHGGAYAGGYEMLYLYKRLQHALEKIDESSEDFLRNLTKSKRRLLIEELDNDYAIVRDETGQYHLTDRQLRERIRELEASENWADETELHQLRREADDRDYVDTYFDEDGSHDVYKRKGGRNRSSRAYTSDYAGTGSDDLHYIAESAEYSGESPPPVMVPQPGKTIQGQPQPKPRPASSISAGEERRRLINQVALLRRINANLRKQQVISTAKVAKVVSSTESQRPGTSTGQQTPVQRPSAAVSMSN